MHVESLRSFDRRESDARWRCGRHSPFITRMVEVNVGVPAPTALFPFAGWGQSFFGDLHVQGTEGIRFYTRSKVVLSRWQYDGGRTQGW
jgi:acyl-CoA reductase-like NAD-dependent aldehyde dehydrogenase